MNQTIPPTAARPWTRARAFSCAVVLLLLAGSPGGQQALAQATRAQPTLPATTLQAGIHLIRAEVAADAAARATGLMFRESLAPNHGMLFVFQEKGAHCFWMRNTLVPLSIAFLEQDGSIVNIEDMAPHSEVSHCPKREVKFALEMEQGWFARRGIGPGTKLLDREFFPAPR